MWAKVKAERGKNSKDSSLVIERAAILFAEQPSLLLIPGTGNKPQQFSFKKTFIYKQKREDICYKLLKLLKNNAIILIYYLKNKDLMSQKTN